jgi:CrcB protein
MLSSLLYVAVGAIFGALARFLVTHFFSELSHHRGFPYGTLIVNVLGCIFVGYVLTATASHDQDRWRLLLATGFCGAFTTFSAFAYESMGYWNDGKVGTFVVNLLANNILCLVAVVLGTQLHHS